MEVTQKARQGLQELIPENQSLVLEALKNEGLSEVQAITVTSGSTLGDNFVAVIHRVAIEGTKVSNGPHLNLSLILKSLPRNIARREAFSTSLIFRNEILFYEKVVPVLQTMLSDHGVPPLCVPCCLRSQCDGEEDALVLEDLRGSGFSMADRVSGLSVEQCELVVRELGKLHALSFALKHTQPQRFSDLSKYVKDMFFDLDRKEAFGAFIDSAFEGTLNIVCVHFGDNVNNKYVKYMKHLASLGYDHIAELIRNTPEEYKVITFGDCWTNNLLFTTDNQSPKVRFLDFQLTRVTSPAAELTYFLFNSIRYAKLAPRYDDMVKTYHEALSQYLTRLLTSRATENIFPLEALHSEMRRCAPYGLAMAGIVLPAVFCPPEFTPNLETVTGNSKEDFVQEYMRQQEANTPEAREQIVELIKHCVDRGYVVTQ